jgi:hypothetical protein
MKRAIWAGLAVILVLVSGALLRGWLVPASRGDLAPEAYHWRLDWPWSPKAEVAVAFPLPHNAPGAPDVWTIVRRQVPQATPLAALQELAAGPAPESGLQPVAPPRARVMQATAGADGVVTAQVEGWEPDPLALEAMARTVGTAVKAVDPSGRPLGAAPAPVAAGGTVTYLWRGMAVPVPATLPDGPDRPAAAVKRLLAGAPPEGVDPMPEGVTLAGVELKGDVAKVSLNLSEGVTQELVAGRWQFAPHAMAIVYTLTDLPGIRRVQFDFPNLPPEARRNCRTPLGVPLQRPDAESARAKGVPA